MGHPEGQASHADVTWCVAVLMSSGADWSGRMKRLAARAPDLRFCSGYVVRDASGWRNTNAGRAFLASIEALSAEPPSCPIRRVSTSSPSSKLPERPLWVRTESASLRPDHLNSTEPCRQFPQWVQEMAQSVRSHRRQGPAGDQCLDVCSSRTFFGFLGGDWSNRTIGFFFGTYCRISAHNRHGERRALPSRPGS